MQKLDVRKVASDRCFSMWEVTGFDPEEIEYIEHGTDRLDKRERLCKVMEDHGNSEGECWMCGYGIYSINHRRDPHGLMIETGSSCD